MIEIAVINVEIRLILDATNYPTQAAVAILVVRTRVTVSANIFIKDFHPLV